MLSVEHCSNVYKKLITHTNKTIITLKDILNMQWYFMMSKLRT